MPPINNIQNASISMIIFSELSSKEFWQEILKQIEFIQEGFKTKGTVLIVYSQKNPNSLFFMICLLIYKFHWSKNKSICYFKSIISNIEFSETVMKFLDFFENMISKKKKVKLSDTWDSTKLDLIVSNTYINSLKGSRVSQPVEVDYSDDEDVRMRKRSKRKRVFKRKKVNSQI